MKERKQPAFETGYEDYKAKELFKGEESPRVGGWGAYKVYNPEREQAEAKRKNDIQALEAVWLYDEDTEAKKLVDENKKYSHYADARGDVSYYGFDYAQLADPNYKDDPVQLLERLIPNVPDETRQRSYREELEKLQADKADRWQYFGLYGRAIRDEVRARHTQAKAEREKLLSEINEEFIRELEAKISTGESLSPEFVAKSGRFFESGQLREKFEKAQAAYELVATAARGGRSKGEWEADVLDESERVKEEFADDVHLSGTKTPKDEDFVQQAKFRLGKGYGLGTQTRELMHDVVELLKGEDGKLDEGTLKLLILALNKDATGEQVVISPEFRKMFAEGLSDFVNETGDFIERTRLKTSSSMQPVGVDGFFDHYSFTQEPNLRLQKEYSPEVQKFKGLLARVNEQRLTPSEKADWVTGVLAPFARQLGSNAIPLVAGSLVPGGFLASAAANGAAYAPSSINKAIAEAFVEDKQNPYLEGTISGAWDAAAEGLFGAAIGKVPGVSRLLDKLAVKSAGAYGFGKAIGAVQANAALRLATGIAGESLGELVVEDFTSETGGYLTKKLFAAAGANLSSPEWEPMERIAGNFADGRQAAATVLYCATLGLLGIPQNYRAAAAFQSDLSALQAVGLKAGTARRLTAERQRLGAQLAEMQAKGASEDMLEEEHRRVADELNVKIREAYRTEVLEEDPVKLRDRLAKEHEFYMSQMEAEASAREGVLQAALREAGVLSTEETMDGKFRLTVVDQSQVAKDAEGWQDGKRPSDYVEPVKEVEMTEEQMTAWAQMQIGEATLKRMKEIRSAAVALDMVGKVDEGDYARMLPISRAAAPVAVELAKAHGTMNLAVLQALAKAAKAEGRQGVQALPGVSNETTGAAAASFERRLDMAEAMGEIAPGQRESVGAAAMRLPATEGVASRIVYNPGHTKAVNIAEDAVESMLTARLKEEGGMTQENVLTPKGRSWLEGMLVEMRRVNEAVKQFSGRELMPGLEKAEANLLTVTEYFSHLAQSDFYRRAGKYGLSPEAQRHVAFMDSALMQGRLAEMLDKGFGKWIGTKEGKAWEQAGGTLASLLREAGHELGSLYNRSRVTAEHVAAVEQARAYMREAGKVTLAEVEETLKQAAEEQEERDNPQEFSGAIPAEESVTGEEIPDDMGAAEALYTEDGELIAPPGTEVVEPKEEAAIPTGEVSPTLEEDIGKAYRRQLKADTMISLCSPPAAFKVLGLPMADIVTHARAIIKLKNKHSLSEAQIVEAVHRLTDPLLILKETEETVILFPGGQAINRKGEPGDITAPVKLERTKDGKHFLASLYPLDSLQKTVSLMEKGNLLYSKYKEADLSTDKAPGLSPELMPQLARVGFRDHTITEEDVVKREEEKSPLEEGGARGVGLEGGRFAPLADGSVMGVARVDSIGLCPDVPQFKTKAAASGRTKAGEDGTTHELAGGFRKDAPPITVWRRTDGALQVITGRHRLAHARKCGETFIAVRVYDEDAAHDAAWAKLYDVEMNILDRQAGAQDVAYFFRNAGMSLEEAEARGLMPRRKDGEQTATGTIGIAVALNACDEVYTRFINGALGEKQAYFIATLGADEAAQELALKLLSDKKPKSFEYVQAYVAAAREQRARSEAPAMFDLFGKDESWAQEADKLARYVEAARRQVSAQLGILKGAGTLKRKEQAAGRLGVTVKTPRDLTRLLTKLAIVEAALERMDASLGLGELAAAWDGKSSPDLETLTQRVSALGEKMPGEALATFSVEAVPSDVVGRLRSHFEKDPWNGAPPAGWWVHGRSGRQDLETGHVLQMTRSNGVGMQYGASGSVWYLRPKADAHILDASTVEGKAKIREALIEGLENGTLPMSYERMEEEFYDEEGELKPEAVEKYVEAFNPKNIVDSAEAFDDVDWCSWLWERLEPDMVVTQDGAVVLNQEAMEGAKVYDARVDWGSFSVEAEEEMAEIKRKSIDEGWFMKAPNGEPTKLTERQWLQVRTKAFKNWFGDWEKAATFRAVRDAIMSMPTVTEISGKEFQSDGVPLTDKVPAYWQDSYHGGVESPELGRVILDKEGVKSSMGHGIGALKAAAFYAVPEVIQKGKVFDRQQNWKGRGYDTAVLAAPISIAGNEYICEVIVEQRPNRQGFYLHEVEVKEKLGNVFKTSTEGGTRQAPRSILALRDAEVNTIWENCSKVVDENGEPLVVYHGTSSPKPFTVFGEKKASSQGSYLEDDQQAFFFAKEKEADFYKNSSVPLMACFLSLKNPKTVDIAQEIEDVLWNYDGDRDEAVSEGYPLDRWEGKDHADFEANDSATAYFDDHAQELYEDAKDQGEDGIMLYGADGTMTVLAFNPNQIKSATDNRGTFDGSNPDITYSLTLGSVQAAQRAVQPYGREAVMEQMVRSIERAGCMWATTFAERDPMESRDVAAEQMGRLMAMAMGIYRALPSGYRAKLTPILRRGQVLSGMLESGKLRNYGRISSEERAKLEAEVEKNLSEQWSQDELDALAQEAEWAKEEAARDVAGKRLPELYDAMAREAAGQMRRYLRDTEVSRIARLLERFTPRVGKNGKMQKGKLEAAMYRKLARLTEMMRATEAVREENIAALAGRIAEAEEREDTQEADRLTAEQMEWCTFGAIKAQSLDAVRKAHAQLLELIGSGRTRWERKMEESKRHVEWLCNKAVAGMGEANDTDLAKARRKAKKRTMWQKLKEFPAYMQSIGQLFYGLGGVPGLGAFADASCRDVTRGHMALAARERDLTQAMEAKLEELGLKTQAQKANFMQHMKSVEDTGVVPEPDIVTRRVKLSMEEARRWVTMSKKERERERETLRKKSEEEQREIPDIPMEEDIVLLAMELEKAASGKRERKWVTAERQVRVGEKKSLRLNRDQALNLILLCEQERYRSGSAAAHGYTDAVLAKLREFVGEKGMAFGYWMRDYLSGTGLAEVFEAREGVPFPAEENYWPGVFDQSGRMNENMNALDSSAGQNSTRYSMLKVRVNHTLNFDLSMGATNAFMGAIAMQNNYICMGELTSQWRRMLANARFARSLRQKAGESAFRAIKDGLNLLDGQGIAEAYGQKSLSRLLSMAQAAHAPAVLAGSFTTLLKQYSALMHATSFPGISAPRLIGEIITNRLGSGKMTYAKMRDEAIFRNRVGNKDVWAELLTMEEDVKWSRLAAWSRKGMNWLEKTDVAANLVSMTALYNILWKRMSEEGGRTEEDMHAACMAAVERTMDLAAQPTRRSQKSLIQAVGGGGVWNATAFYMATEVMNKIGMVIATYKRGGGGKKGLRKSMKFLVTMSCAEQAMMVIIDLLRGSCPDTDNEDGWLQWLALHAATGITGAGLLSGVPILGSFVNTITGGYVKTNSLADALGLDLWPNGKKLYRMATGKKERSAAEWSLQLLNASRALTGGLGAWGGGANSCIRFVSSATSSLQSVNAAGNIVRPALQRAANSEKQDKKPKKTIW